MTKKSDIEKRLAELDVERTALKGQLKQLKAAKQFKCVWCNKMHAFKSCEAVQGYHWVSARAYEDGYYTPTEIYIICPVTRNTNRMLFDSAPYGRYREFDYDANEQFAHKYKDAFKVLHGGVEAKSETLLANGSWKNNYYINENLHKYDIVLKK